MIKYLFLNLKQDFLYYIRYLKFVSFLKKVIVALKDSGDVVDYEKLYETISNKKYLYNYVENESFFTADVKRNWYSKKLKVTFNSYIFNSNLILALNYLKHCGYIKQDTYYQNAVIQTNIEIESKLHEDTFKDTLKEIHNCIVVSHFKYYSY